MRLILFFFIALLPGAVHACKLGFALVQDTSEYQGKLHLTSGVGAHELIHLGIRYQNGNQQYGIKLGSFPKIDGDKTFAVSADYYCHLFGKTNNWNRPTWFLRASMIYWNINYERYIQEHYILNLRIGKEVNFSPKSGLEFDFGLASNIGNNKITKAGPSLYSREPVTVIPCLSIAFVFRII